MILSREKCEACRQDSLPVTNEEISKLQKNVPLWSLKRDEKVLYLHRIFKIGNFATAMAFAGRVGDAAEEEGHHPRLTIVWGRVEVSWWTHKIGGLHRNDFIMAAKTDEIYAGIV